MGTIIGLTLLGILYLYDVTAAASSNMSLDPEMFKRALVLFNESIGDKPTIKKICEYVAAVGPIQDQLDKIPQILDILPKLNVDEKVSALQYISGVETQHWINANPGATLQQIKAHYKEISDVYVGRIDDIIQREEKPKLKSWVSRYYIIVIPIIVAGGVILTLAALTPTPIPIDIPD